MEIFIFITYFQFVKTSSLKKKSPFSLLWSRNFQAAIPNKLFSKDSLMQKILNSYIKLVFPKIFEKILNAINHYILQNTVVLFYILILKTSNSMPCINMYIANFIMFFIFHISFSWILQRYVPYRIKFETSRFDSTVSCSRLASELFCGSVSSRETVNRLVSIFFKLWKFSGCRALSLLLIYQK